MSCLACFTYGEHQRLIGLADSEKARHHMSSFLGRVLSYMGKDVTHVRSVGRLPGAELDNFSTWQWLSSLLRDILARTWGTTDGQGWVLRRIRDDNHMNHYSLFD